MIKVWLACCLVAIVPATVDSACCAQESSSRADDQAASDVTSANASGEVPPPDLGFVRDVVPALTKAGCNAGACHGSFQGRGGLQLSLLGFDPQFDYDALTKAARGRRVNPAAPNHSLLLLKPTGAVPHGGGRRCDERSEVYRTLRRWIAAGLPAPEPADLAGPRLEVRPSELRLAPGERHQLRVTATWPSAATRDVTQWVLYDSREPSTAEISGQGRVVAGRPGRTALTVRFAGQVAAVPITVPFGPPADSGWPGGNRLDDLVAAEWRSLGLRPTRPTTDDEFCRRVFLDLIGTLPTVEEVRAFHDDTDPHKRETLIDRLLDRPEYVDYWALRWGDLLRMHRRYLGDKGLASFQVWLRKQVRENRPVDQLVRDLITAQGNLFSHGAVAFYFLDEKLEDLTENAAQALLGVRLQCTRCHHHPQEVWSQDDYYGLAAFFTRLETKDSGQQGARFGGPKSIRALRQPHASRPLARPVAPRLLGDSFDLTAYEADIRVGFADWLTRPSNPYFARNLVNRYWNALFGRGLIEPVDDLRATNPPAMPRLVDALVDHFVAHQFDAKDLLRTIARSRVYQLATDLDATCDLDGQLLTHHVPRRLPAEVLLDAINQAAGTTEAFEGQPVGTRAIALPDPAIPSYFLTTFGRPLRNSPCECSRGSTPDLAQTLHLANSPAMHQKISHPQGRVARLMATGATDEACIEQLYLATLSRAPTEREQATAQELIRAVAPRAEAFEDLLWALLNTAEFGYQH